MTSFTRHLWTTTAVLGFAAGAAQAQNLITSNTSIHSSLCVGFDCLTTESYGFDTVRLKENNLRINADDTSTTSSFPSNDWRLIFNSSANGGGSYFEVQDATAGNNVFRVVAGARANALYVDSQGDVGIGTATPATDIDIKIGDTPTVRLQQDGSSGFTAQTWDVAGNESGFFIRDATGGSTLPFRIITGGAPSQSLVIDGDGEVGVGAGTNPSASLHVRRSDGSARLLVEETSGTATARTVAEFINNGRPDMVLANSSTSKEWSVGGGTNMVFKSGALGSLPSAKTTRFTLFDTGNATLTGTLTTGGGTCGGGCDLVFTEDYDLPSIVDHAEKMFSLGYLPNVGPTREHAPINVSDKLGRMLNELEHAHIYIAELEARDRDRQAQIAELAERLAAVESGASPQQ